jgi:hypothetical protein
MDQCSQETEMSRSPLLESEWTRRLVLKTSLAGLYLLGCRVLWPEKSAGGGLPPGRLSLYNVQTDEHVTVTYRDDSGQYDQSARERGAKTIAPESSHPYRLGVSITGIP